MVFTCNGLDLSMLVIPITESIDYKSTIVQNVYNASTTDLKLPTSQNVPAYHPMACCSSRMKAGQIKPQHPALVPPEY